MWFCGWGLGFLGFGGCFVWGQTVLNKTLTFKVIILGLIVVLEEKVCQHCHEPRGEIADKEPTTKCDNCGEDFSQQEPDRTVDEG